MSLGKTSGKDGMSEPEVTFQGDLLPHSIAHHRSSVPMDDQPSFPGVCLLLFRSL